MRKPYTPPTITNPPTFPFDEKVDRLGCGFPGGKFGGLARSRLQDQGLWPSDEEVIATGLGRAVEMGVIDRLPGRPCRTFDEFHQFLDDGVSFASPAVIKAVRGLVQDALSEMTGGAKGRARLHAEIESVRMSTPIPADWRRQRDADNGVSVKAFNKAIATIHPDGKPGEFTDDRTPVRTHGVLLRVTWLALLFELLGQRHHWKRACDIVGADANSAALRKSWHRLRDHGCSANAWRASGRVLPR
jgi:hypothetical protein